MNCEKPLDPGDCRCLSRRQPTGSAGRTASRNGPERLWQHLGVAPSETETGREERAGRICWSGERHRRSDPAGFRPRKLVSASADTGRRIRIIGSARGTRLGWCGVRSRPEQQGMQAPTVARKCNFPAGSSEPTGKLNSQWKRYCRDDRLWWMLSSITTPPGRRCSRLVGPGVLTFFALGRDVAWCPSRRWARRQNSVAGSTYGSPSASATAASVSLPSMTFSPFRMCGFEARTRS